MKKTAALIVAVLMVFGTFGTVHAEGIQSPGMPVIGIAWRADTDSEFFTNVCKAVEAAAAALRNARSRSISRG